MFHKSRNAPIPYPTMHHFVTEMCIFVVHCGICVWSLRDLWGGSIETNQNQPVCMYSNFVYPNIFASKDMRVIRIWYLCNAMASWYSYYSDVIISVMASQIAGVSMVCSTVCPKKISKIHVTDLWWGNHRWPVVSPHRSAGTRKMF